MAAVIALGSIVYSSFYVASHNDNIYLVDGRGNALSATHTSTGVDRELEVVDHVTRFHELMFNLSPSSDAIKRNIDRALVMCDRSGFKYYNDQAEKGYYTGLVQGNIIQQIVIDSVSVNMNVYPYTETTYAKLYVLRESNITMYDFMSVGQLVDIGRSKDNPHGLMLEKFYVPKTEMIQQRKRK